MLNDAKKDEIAEMNMINAGANISRKAHAIINDLSICSDNKNLHAILIKLEEAEKLINQGDS